MNWMSDKCKETWRWTLSNKLKRIEMKLKYYAILSFSLLVSCQSPEFNRPILNDCRVFNDVENCQCINSKGVKYTRSCWGDLSINPDKQQQLEEYVKDLEKCIIEYELCSGDSCQKCDRLR